MHAAVERDVVITGMGAVCALAGDCAGLWRAIAERRCGIAPIRRFSTSGFDVQFGAFVERWADPQPPDRDLTATLCRSFAQQALDEALRSASIDAKVARSRIALVLGTGIADLAGDIHAIAEDVAAAFAITGPCITVSTACSSSTASIALARELLTMDSADVVIAGGADVLTPEVFAGFHALGVLSRGKCAPFSTPMGTTLGEGAGFLVLERRSEAELRRASVIAAVSGSGLSGDGWHETSPEPKGSGVERAIRSALADAGVSAAEVGYVNMHGSGTEANDLSEWLGVQRALGPDARDIPVSSTKGALGHAQGAAGVLETIVTLLAMKRNFIPPTLNFAARRAHSPADPVPGPEPRSATWNHALKLNSAFGGSNATLLLSRCRTVTRQRVRSGVSILGVGEVGPSGLGLNGFTTDACRSMHVPDFSIEDLIPDARARGLDPSSRFLSAATFLSLEDAGITVRGSLRERAGLFVGQLRASPASIVAFQRSIEERGLHRLKAAAFARIVLNAAAGACSALLSLRGPLSALTTGDGSALAAIILAAELLSTRDNADIIVAGGCDEHAPLGIDGAMRHGEGASCVVLGRSGAPGDVRVALIGWALAGPGRLAEAVERATRRKVDQHPAKVFRAEETNAGPGARGAVAVAAAVRALRAGETEHALVTCAAGNSVASAVYLAREAA